MKLAIECNTIVGNVRSNMLLKAKVSIVAREKCNENYSMWRKLPDGIAEEQLCAGDPQGLRDTCQVNCLIIIIIIIVITFPKSSKIVCYKTYLASKILKTQAYNKAATDSQDSRFQYPLLDVAHDFVCAEQKKVVASLFFQTLFYIYAKFQRVLFNSLAYKL